MAETSQTFRKVIHTKNGYDTKNLNSFVCMDGTRVFENDDAVYEKYTRDKEEIEVRHMGQKPAKNDEIEWFKRPNEIESNKTVKFLSFYGSITYLMRAFQFIETMPTLEKVSFLLGWRDEVYGHNFFCPKLSVNSKVTILEIKVDTTLYKKDTRFGKFITNLMLLDTLKMAFKCFPSLKYLKLFVPKLSQEEFPESFESILENNLPDMERNEANYRKTYLYKSGLDYVEYRVRWPTMFVEIPKPPKSISSMSSISSASTLVIDEYAHIDVTCSFHNLEDLFSSNEHESVTRGIKRSSSESMCDDDIFGLENTEAEDILDFVMFDDHDYSFDYGRTLEELEEDGAFSRPQRKRKR